METFQGFSKWVFGGRLRKTVSVMGQRTVRGLGDLGYKISSMFCLFNGSLILLLNTLGEVVF